MAHILDGKWRSFVVIAGNAFDDKEIKIKVDESNNRLEPNSTHGGDPVTGTVLQGSNFLTITIKKGNRRYKGILVSSGASMTISGFVDLDASLVEPLIKKAGETGEAMDVDILKAELDVLNKAKEKSAFGQ